MGVFKVGDQVRCVDAGGAVGLKKGAVYAVAGLSADGICVRVGVDDADHGWLDDRFELVVPAPSPTPDAVFRPSHYARFPIEPITFLTANRVGFLPGNVIKYVMRHDAKNGLEDLRKARRYLDIMIEDEERRGRGETLVVETV